MSKHKKKCKKTSKFESPCSYMQKLAFKIVLENLDFPKKLTKGVKND